MNLYLNKERLAHFDALTVFDDIDGVDVEIKTQYDVTHGEVCLQNGQCKARIRLTKTFTIPHMLLTAGRITGYVQITCGQTVIKKWDISPLTVVERDNTIQTYDALVGKIQELEERITRLEENSEIIV